MFLKQVEKWIEKSKENFLVIKFRVVKHKWIFGVIKIENKANIKLDLSFANGIYCKYILSDKEFKNLKDLITFLKNHKDTKQKEIEFSLWKLNKKPKWIKIKEG